MVHHDKYNCVEYNSTAEVYFSRRFDLTPMVSGCT